MARHGFFPFIMRPVKVCHFREDATGRRRHAHKVRPVTYAAHMDSHIHAYYAHVLSGLLDERLQEAFGESVLAYRRHSPPKSNVDFALEAFEEVAARRSADVLAIDVEGFFDGLNHGVLKQAWATLLGGQSLTADHYAVFRSVTRDYAVEWPRVRTALGERYRRRAGRRGEPLCSLSDFRTQIVPLLQPRHELVWKVKQKEPPACIPKGVPAGIPQGAAISAVLANLYMLSVDQELYAKLGALGASYRRYSDDILVIGPPGSMARTEKRVRQALTRVGLAINVAKTERVEFRLQGSRMVPTFVTVSGVRQPARPMQYLGLSFDGEWARVRDATVSRYLVRMTRAVRRGRLAARAQGTKKIRRRKIYATMSSLGAGRAYGRWKRIGDEWRPERAPRPGYLKYADRVDRKAASSGISAVESQNERAWQQLHRALSDEQARL